MPFHCSGQAFGAMDCQAPNKRGCDAMGTDVTTKRVQIVRTNGQQFEVDAEERSTILELKERIAEGKFFEGEIDEMQLIHGVNVLADTVVLFGTAFQDDEILTLVKRKAMGTTELRVSRISDDTQWHSKHKFALRSGPLPDEVEKIHVSVGECRVGGWGGCQARLFIYLHNPADNDNVVASRKIFGPLRTGEDPGRSPSCTLDASDEVVSLAQPGMVYKLRYQCGGGGGHSIYVKDWCCKVYPKSRTTDEPLVQVTGSVNLQNVSRLGGDRTTGMWELQEPPFPDPFE